ncbi:hypothetical protein [Schinkia azotoformans]|nr:hypothetical protein [Schinkia azotoformans]MEC1747881.1 hypothetical protein [Schinkia azotoformans]MED4378666.1 hypothetical protein [Schinkia azotoformans]
MKSYNEGTSQEYRIILANRTTSLIHSFLIIPACISLISILILPYSQHSFLIELLPNAIIDKSTEAINNYQVLKLIFFFWFKLLIGAQGILIGLVSIEFAKYGLQKKPEQIRKYVTKKNELNSKIKNSSGVIFHLLNLRLWFIKHSIDVWILILGV